jgi:hypothetical protein
MAAPLRWLAVASTKPGMPNVVLQLLAAEQLLPVQHWRPLLATVCSPDSVMVVRPPAELSKVVLATPAALKVSVPAPKRPALVATLAVVPLTPVNGVVHGLLLSPQAVTVTGVGVHLALVGASVNS